MRTIRVQLRVFSQYLAARASCYIIFNGSLTHLTATRRASRVLIEVLIHRCYRSHIAAVPPQPDSRIHAVSPCQAERRVAAVAAPLTVCKEPFVVLESVSCNLHERYHVAHIMAVTCVLGIAFKRTQSLGCMNLRTWLITKMHTLNISDIHFNSFATRNRREVLSAMSADDEESYSVRTMPAILQFKSVD